MVRVHKRGWVFFCRLFCFKLFVNQLEDKHIFICIIKLADVTVIESFLKKVRFGWSIVWGDVSFLKIKVKEPAM